MTRTRSTGCVCALLAGLAFASAGRADLIAQLTSVTPDGSNFDWNYTFTIQADSRLDPAATNGVTCLSFTTTCTPPGTFLTIHDVAGLIAVQAPPAGWIDSVQNSGITPQQTSPIDSASSPNVTFTAILPGINFIQGGATGVDIAGFTLVDSFGISPTHFSNFTSQSTSDVFPTSGASVQHLGVVQTPQGPGPAVPEPATLALFGLGIAAIGVLRRRRAR